MFVFGKLTWFCFARLGGGGGCALKTKQAWGRSSKGERISMASAAEFG